MQIHVVRPGQTLYGIAQTYSVTVDRLVETNKIPNPNNLVTGQALVIPIVGSYYFVQSGDSLYLRFPKKLMSLFKNWQI